MTTPAPKPRKSRRMVVWLVAVPIAILLLALAGANWKVFHLAYAKHLMDSSDPKKHYRGVKMVLQTHLRGGTSLEEVRRLLGPAMLAETDYGMGPFLAWDIPPLRVYRVFVKRDPLVVDIELGFDDGGKLRAIRDGTIVYCPWPLK